MTDIRIAEVKGVSQDDLRAEIDDIWRRLNDPAETEFRKDAEEEGVDLVALGRIKTNPFEVGGGNNLDVGVIAVAIATKVIEGVATAVILSALEAAWEKVMAPEIERADRTVRPTKERIEPTVTRPSGSATTSDAPPK